MLPRRVAANQRSVSLRVQTRAVRPRIQGGGESEWGGLRVGGGGLRVGRVAVGVQALALGG